MTVMHPKNMRRSGQRYSLPFLPSLPLFPLKLHITLLSCACMGYLKRAPDLNTLQALPSLSVYVVVYPMAFCCIAITKLLVVHRMMDFSELKGAGERSRWATLARVLLAVIVGGNAVGLVSVIPASVLFNEARAASQENETAYEKKIIKAASVGAIHLGVETFMLLIIVLAVCCWSRQRASHPCGFGRWSKPSDAGIS